MRLHFFVLWAGDNKLNTWLAEEFLFLLKWVIKFSLKWVTSCRSYVRFILLLCQFAQTSFADLVINNINRDFYNIFYIVFRITINDGREQNETDN